MWEQCTAAKATMVDDIKKKKLTSRDDLGPALKDEYECRCVGQHGDHFRPSAAAHGLEAYSNRKNSAEQRSSSI